MKILMVNALYPPHRVGGAEKSVALLSESLVRAGDAVVVVTLDDIAEPTRSEERGIVVHRLPIDNIYWPYGDVDAARSKLQRLRWHWNNRWNRRAAARVGELLDAERPDVVHCHVLTGFSVAVWQEVKRRGIPLVQTLHDYAVICTRSALFKNGATCERRCAECVILTSPGKQASRMVDQLVSISHFVIAAHRKEGYFAGVPPRRIFNIVPVTPHQRTARVDDAPLVFGFIGRVEAEKGIEVVLAACERIKDRDWQLKIAGVGVSAYVEDLKRRYPDPRIEWLGYTVADSFYASIDVLLMSSVWPEPLSLTLIEALTHGLSAICAQSGGVPEIADLPRKSISYPATDDAALASAMMTAIAERADWRKGGLAPGTDLAMFSEREIVRANQAVYLEAIGAGAPAVVTSQGSTER